MNEAPGMIKALSRQEIDAIEAQIAHLPDRESAAIEALQIVQRTHGWVSDDNLHATAELLGMSDAALDSIATFYNLIYRQPVGRHIVMLCDSVSCFVMDAKSLRRRMSETLRIELGETTADGRFTLLPIVCLGACDRAPVMLVDDQLFGAQQLDDLDAILARFP